MDFSIDSVNEQFVFSVVGQVCQNVTIVNDNLLEFDEQFYVNLTNVVPPGVQLQPLNTTSVVINDDEGMTSLIQEWETKLLIKHILAFLSYIIIM